MRRGRSRIGTELVPLILILASLAGSLALVIAIHRRFVSRSTVAKPSVAVVATPVLTPTKPKPTPIAPEPEAEEPEPLPPSPPEDPTPKVVAKLVAAEADQLLEASKADRKASALEAAKKAAQLESERWRRRESLVRLQLDSLETKVHQLETKADELALERDALEKEVDARKALAAQARSRPSTAILPHRGQNGTWRRPIVVECVNGTAIIRPQGISFGLLELASGFGPSTNPFVATIAREAIRIQGNASPDGQLVTPYIFFLVRPDGIRTYYEARGRLEALGITFGYELADQDWEIDFPDLDDIKSWDGSGPAQPPKSDPLAQIRSRQSGNSPAEDESLPNLNLGSSPGNSQETGPDGIGSEFTWPPKPRNAPSGNGRVTLGGSSSGTGSGGIGNANGSRVAGPSGVVGGLSNSGPGFSGSNGGVRFPGGTSGAGFSDSNPGSGSGPSDLPPLAAPRELALGGPVTPLQPGSPGNPGNPPPKPNSTANGSGNLPPVVSPRTSPMTGTGTSAMNPAQPGTGSDPTDPPSPYVLPSPGLPPEQLAQARPATSSSAVSPNQTPPVRHLGPFSKPFAEGVDPSLIANASSPPLSATTPPDDSDPTQPDSFNPGSASGSTGSQTPNSSGSSSNSARNPNQSQKPGTGTNPSRVIGPGDSSNSPPPSDSPPPPLTLGLNAPGSPPSGMPPISSPTNMTPPTETSTPPRSPRPAPNASPADRFKFVDQRFEIVVVCNQRGVIVQPGSYRVTLDALKNRDGLLKSELVALVKARRTADPKLTIEPRVRFLVQPGGESTYWMARGQFLLSGLDWPISTQVADPDPLTILPTESWR